MQGHFYPGSEDDAPYFPYCITCTGPLTPESFRAASRLASWWQIEISPAVGWLEQVLANIDDDQRPLYHCLRGLLVMTTPDLSPPHMITARAHTGRFHRSRIHLVRHVQDSELAGLRVFSVET